MSPAETPTPKRISNVSTRRRRKVQFEPLAEEESFENDVVIDKNNDVKDNVNGNVQEVSDLRAKIESLELEKIELERKNTDRLQTENPDENQNILIESAQDIGDIKYTILGKYRLKFLTCTRCFPEGLMDRR